MGKVSLRDRFILEKRQTTKFAGMRQTSDIDLIMANEQTTTGQMK